MGNEDNNIPTSNSRRSLLGSKKFKKPAVFIGMFLLLALIIAGTMFAINRNNAAKKAQLEQQKQAVKVEFEAAIKEADTLAGAQKYTEAIAKLESVEPKLTEQSQKFAVYSRLGNIYYYTKNWQQAVTWYQRAQQVDPQKAESLSLSLALSAENVGNKEVAISAYKQVIEQMKKMPGPYARSSVGQYENKVKDLGGSL